MLIKVDQEVLNQIDQIIEKALKDKENILKSMAIAYSPYRLGDAIYDKVSKTYLGVIKEVLATDTLITVETDSETFSQQKDIKIIYKIKNILKNIIAKLFSLIDIRSEDVV